MRSLSTRLIVAIVLVIVVTTFAAGVPAYQIVRDQLDQQAWERVADGGRVALTLFEAEQASLLDLAMLTAQRPTLRTLLQTNDTADLSAYLQTFQSSTDLDILLVRDSQGQLAAHGDSRPLEFDLPFVSGIALQPLTDQEPSLALLASQSVFAAQGGDLLGYVTVGLLLDDDFAQHMATETGLEQSIVMEGRRIATSLPDPPPTADPVIVRQATLSGRPTNTTLTLGTMRYYVALLPLHGAQREVVALLEVALPVDEVAAAQNQALLALVLSTLLVAVISSILGGWYARRLTVPLRQLTGAAHRISHGDYITPVPIPKEPLEVATLASALEESRVNTRRALGDLSQSKEWSETLIQSVVEGIVTFDTGGHVTFFSHGAELITGWLRDEVLGQPINKVFPLPEGNGQFLDRIPSYGGKRQIGVLTKGGRRTTLAVTGARLKPPHSTAVQVALVLRDITEEEAIQNLRAYFLANISHEFRTPLAALSASVELLLEDFDDLSSAEIDELLSSIHLSVTGLQTLIDNLLESISIEAGRFRIRRRMTNIDDVIAEAVRVMQPLLDRRHQQLSRGQLSDLPPINADPARLTQVLVNLLSNASKYSPVGKPIDLVVEQLPTNLLRLSVSDRGAGITPLERESLFRRFVRLDTEDGTQYGIGLGLSVVKIIVEEHGGKVGVDERPGGGSTFWFTIPMVDATR